MLLTKEIVGSLLTAYRSDKLINKNHSKYRTDLTLFLNAPVNTTASNIVNIISLIDRDQLPAFVVSTINVLSMHVSLQPLPLYGLSKRNNDIV